jgi:multidrug efflux pump subunit AcrA (membrane-fusion protein)
MKKPVKYLLVAGLVAAGLATGVCVYLSVGRKSEAQSAPQAERMPVVFAQVREMVFEKRVQVSGNVEAKHTALVSARVPGALDNVFVDEGDPVKAGETKLFQTDKVKLGRAVESAEQQVVVATARVSAQQAAVEALPASV